MIQKLEKEGKAERMAWAKKQKAKSLRECTS